MNRYYSFNEYCHRTFGEKVYRLSLNAGMTCPNRDGTLDTRGCAFCSSGGSGDFAPNATLSVTEQIEQAKQMLSAKTKCKKFIAYFQAFTNTYAPISKLRDVFGEAISHPDIVAVSIATRSDCLSDEVIALLAELNQKKPIWIELGLQTIYDNTLCAMRTHTTLAQFDDALFRLTQAQIPVIAHLILGLPGETKEMMKKSVAYLARSSIFGIKLQLLHILKGTELADIYERESFPTFSMEEYCDFVIDCVEMLPPHIVICRLTGDGPKKLLIAPLWSADKKKVLNTLNRRFVERDSWQGKEYFNG